MNRFNQQCARIGIQRETCCACYLVGVLAIAITRISCMTLSLITPRRPQSVANLARGMILVLAVFLSSHGSSYAQRAVGPFERLAGQWVGTGTIDLSNGTREPIKCRAAYDVLAERHNLQLNIRCASDSYNFNIYSSADLAGHAVGGTWSESTHAAGGAISGTAEGDHIQVRAKSPGFTADLSLATRGNRQSVVIKAADPNAGIMGATINLRRRG